MTAEITVRPAGPDDLEILWDFLAIAAYEPNAAVARSVPRVAVYLVGWPRPQDFGFIAERNGLAIGSVWARQFAPPERPGFWFGERTPRITIGVKEHDRGQGVGRMLLRALIAEAAPRGLRLCLSVRHDNPARRLYERMGFQIEPDATAPNRGGGQSIGMVLDEPS